jgi:RimJ/RimL family protein N-acetyltransferase
MLAAAKVVGKPFLTNFFLSDAAVEPQVRAGEVEAFEAEGAAILLRREARFDRLYYAAAGEDCLKNALSEVAAEAERDIVVDVVGREDAIAPVVERFRESGFEKHDALVRLQRTTPREIGADAPDPEVETGRPDDAPEILAALANNFDAYSDQIPSLSEIRDAAAAGTIALVRAEGRIAALYYYDRAGLTCQARYWLVLPEFRSRRALGDKVLRRFLAACADAKRCILWVHQENRPVLAVYRWYGFAADGLVDTILIHRR